METSAPDIYWPEELDERYEFRRRLSTGRMASVVHAIERNTGRDFDLKVMHEHLLEQEPIRRRIRRQLAAVRRLEHPSIVRVYDLLETDEAVALIMEHVDGVSVRDRVRRSGPMSWQEAKPVLDSVLAGLEEAHRKGILHRDVNAEHVVVDDDGTGRIAGFGIARVDELVALTMHTRLLGALEAMAPERILGMDYDTRADLYSVGAVAHEMLLGHPPVDGSMREAFSRATQGKSLPVDELPDELPREAKYLLERSLVGDVSARFATATQMRRALRGGYDDEMWKGWAGRDTDHCPGCDWPVIDGLVRCVICGHEFRRLVQRPGEGDWMVRIISPHEAFEPEVWFESNMEPKYLSEKQFDALMRLLEAHEDTENLADRDWEYRWPPYVLLSDLDREDARRVSSKLHDREIPHEITRSLPGVFEVALSGSGRSTGVMVAIALMLITGVFVAHVDVPVPDSLAIGGFFAFVAALVASQLLLVPLKRRLGSKKDVERRNGHAFMIPTEALCGAVEESGTTVLPEGTGAILEGFDDEAVQREVFELLVLAVSLSRRGDAEVAEACAELVDEVLEIGELLDGAASRVGKERTVELFDRLRRLKLKKQDIDDPNRREELARNYRQCLDDLEAHDRDVFDVTMLRARLITVRGALLDLRSDAEVLEIDDEVVLSFEEQPEESLEELKRYLEVGREMEDVAEVAEVKAGE